MGRGCHFVHPTPTTHIAIQTHVRTKKKGNHSFVEAEKNATRESDDRRKRKMLCFPILEEDKGENVGPKKVSRKEERNGEEEMEYEERLWGLKPLGDTIKVSDDGEGLTNYYGSFEYVGVLYQLEDCVLLEPEHKHEKPYVAIIKNITRTPKQPMVIEVQWFYRPEDLWIDGTPTHPSDNSTELFYSHHWNKVPAQSVKHRCDWHLRGENPKSKELLSFSVNGVYNHLRKKLYELTDKTFKHGNRQEFDVLVKKVLEELWDVNDVELQDNVSTNFNHVKDKRPNSRRSMLPSDDSLVDRADTSESHNVIAPKWYSHLSSYKSLTKDALRHKCLEKLLRSLEEYMAESVASVACPNEAVFAIARLEEAMHKAFSADKQKYKQKTMQLEFNFKKSAVLARRLLNGELKPDDIVKMQANALKDGLIEKEKLNMEPEELEVNHWQGYQMTDVCCEKCSEKKVVLLQRVQVTDYVHYQLHCDGCGSDFVSKEFVPTLQQASN